MNVKQTFLNLTKHTVPHKKEIDYLKDILPMNIFKNDPVGNLYIKLGNSNTMFTSHLDTVGGDKEVVHVIEKNMIKTDGNSILGGDDKAGVTLMLYMIKSKVPGLYVFFMGEEVGCVGSRALSTWVEKNKNDERYKDINKVVSFDRKGTSSVITYQMGERCCSDDFAESLITEFKRVGLTYRTDTGGVLTDSVHFTDLYSECTNLSTGYFSQHMNSEKQDIEFLEKLCIASTKIDWDNLKISRKPGESERLSYGRSSHNYGGSGYGSDEWEDYYGEYNTSHSSGVGRNWHDTHRSSQNSGGNVTDWEKNTVPMKDAVWCEFDNVYCLKTDAIWVDLLGFYTTPDDSTTTTPKKGIKKTDPGISKKYTSYKSEILKSGDELTPNDAIIHPIFGKGKIITISDDKKKVVVKFGDNTTKQLLLSVAKIKKI